MCINVNIHCLYKYNYFETMFYAKYDWYLFVCVRARARVLRLSLMRVIH
jgi:hypothetical protein